MRFPTACLAAAALLAVANGSPSRPNMLFRRKDDVEPYEGSRLDAIKETFTRSWKGYRKYAWGHDSLRPITKGWVDDRNGWGASAVDALSTAIIMEDEEVIKDVLEYVPTIDWLNTTMDVSLFETTIRYLGGFLSAYDLLKGPYKHLAPSKKLVNGLLEQATELADLLKVAFNTTSGLPDNELSFQPKPHIKGEDLNWLATVGTLVLEWGRLSDLTGNPEYGKLARKGESYLLNPQPPESEPFPGMVGSRLFVENGTFADNSGSWAGGTDSFYEYLIKMWVYDPSKYEFYKERWIEAVESSIKYLTSHPSTRPELTFLSIYAGQTKYFYSGHLACFNGGNFILGGLVLKEPRYVDFGLELTAACHETYTQTSTGIGPELFAWQDNATAPDAFNNPPPPPEQAEFYKKAGFWVMNGQYVLRPEVIESFYYAYRATGDEMYRDWAWEAFLSINETCSVGEGLSAIAQVVPVNGTIEYMDFQESFWFAEVMKYSYLIQMDGDEEVHVQKDGVNKWVFNTEAHPVCVFDAARDNRTDEVVVDDGKEEQKEEEKKDGEKKEDEEKKDEEGNDQDEDEGDEEGEDKGKGKGKGTG